jgi:hypothetical protein
MMGAVAVSCWVSACTPVEVHVGVGLSADRTFYVSARGDDRADGRASDRAWRTLDRVNSERLVPGDRVLLEGGGRFAGSVKLDARDAGDATRLVTVGSYGDGRATITSSGASAVSVLDTAGVRIQDLTLIGDGVPTEAADGVTVFNDRSSGGRLDRVEVAGVEVSGFANGIAVGARAAGTGFRRVNIANSVLHDNRKAGLTVYGPAFDASAPGYAHEDVTVSGVEAYGNRGEAGAVTNTGSGIVLGSVAGGVVEESSAHDNGGESSAPQGPIGIWAYDSTGVVLQRSVSFSNRTRFADGGGFGLDQNVSNSLVQQNLSYDNDGAGYLLYTNQSNGSHRDNTVRFNVSSDDSRNGSAYGGITIGGGFTGPASQTVVTGDQVFHNTVVMSAHDGQLPPALRVAGTLARVAIRNNLFITNGGSPQVVTGEVSADGVGLQGNDYFGGRGAVKLIWRDTTYRDLATWRSATGQETLAGAATGAALDPGVVGPHTPMVVRSATGLGATTGVQLQPGSPVAQAGLDLTALFGTDVGGHDFFGRAVPTFKPAIGASQDQ